MSSRCRFPALAVLALGALLLQPAVHAWAQFPPGIGPGRPAQLRPDAKPAPVDPSGTIEAIGPGVIKIKTVADEPWMLQLSRETKVQIAGTANKEVLQPRSFVSFVAQVDKQRSQVQGKVEKLTLFTPSQQHTLGAFPEAAPGGGDASDPFGPDPFGGPPPQRQKRARDRGKETGPPVETFQIAGRIGGIKKDGKISVYVPNRYFRSPIEIELAEEPEIELDLLGPNFLSLAKPGDQLHARGRQIGPNAARVTEVTVTLAEPLGAEKPEADPRRRTPRTRRTRSAEREKAVEVEKEPAEKPDN